MTVQFVVASSFQTVILDVSSYGDIFVISLVCILSAIACVKGRPASRLFLAGAVAFFLKHALIYSSLFGWNPWTVGAVLFPGFDVVRILGLVGWVLIALYWSVLLVSGGNELGSGAADKAAGVAGVEGARNE